MAVEEVPREISRAPEFREAEEIIARAPTNVSGALESHAESLEEFADHLNNEAIKMRARAHRLRELAEEARKEGHFGQPVTADVMSHPLSAEKAIRDLLMATDMPMEEEELADRLGTSKAVLRKRIEPLINSRKVGSITRARKKVYAWMEMDVREGDAPNVAPRSSPRPSSAPGGVVPLTERGTPVRIRTERKTRRSLSTPGARQKAKQRQNAYEKQQAAVEARRAIQAAKTATPKKKKTLSPAAEARRKANMEKAEADKVRSSSKPSSAKK
jgi:hypothetical protein